MKLSRRQFLVASTLATIGVLSGGYLYRRKTRKKELDLENGEDIRMPDDKESDVFIVKTNDRLSGILSLLEKMDLSDYAGKTVALKANFNSAHPFPASTHIDTLSFLVDGLKKAGVSSLTLAERSGMGNTRDVLEQLDVYDMAEKLGFEVVNLEDEEIDRWVKIEADWMHWQNGFYISKIFLEADRVVQTCCLKTHRYGGHFTMSLKNSVGLVAEKVPYEFHNYMRELHGSPNQRLMIAEINKFYDVDFIVMDAIKSFVNKGPEMGDIVTPNLMLASKDRVALDAVGIAILRSYGSTDEVMNGEVFEQEQVKRAAEIGLGVNSAEKIRIVPINDEATVAVDEINRFLIS